MSHRHVHYTGGGRGGRNGGNFDHRGRGANEYISRGGGGGRGNSYGGRGNFYRGGFNQGGQGHNTFKRKRDDDDGSGALPTPRFGEERQSGGYGRSGGRGRFEFQGRGRGKDFKPYKPGRVHDKHLLYSLNKFKYLAFNFPANMIQHEEEKLPEEVVIIQQLLVRVGNFATFTEDDNLTENLEGLAAMLSEQGWLLSMG